MRKFNPLINIKNTSALLLVICDFLSFYGKEINTFLKNVKIYSKINYERISTEMKENKLLFENIDVNKNSENSLVFNSIDNNIGEIGNPNYNLIDDSPYNNFFSVNIQKLSKLMQKLNFLILLISINLTAQTTEMFFGYDESGNQKYRGPILQVNKQPEMLAESLIINTENPSHSKLDQFLSLAPVPVKTNLQVFWTKELNGLITKIELLAYNSFQILASSPTIDVNDDHYTFQMGGMPYGVYYLRFTLSDSSIYTRTVTKQP